MFSTATAVFFSLTWRTWWSTKAATCCSGGSVETLGLWGGTLLQWLVPFLLAGYFFTQRQAVSFAFCAFFFFENWLYTATYMADARAMVLPLVTTGDPDHIEHDWNAIFSSLGVLQYDTTIAGVVRFLGGVGCWEWWGGWCGGSGMQSPRKRRRYLLTEGGSRSSWGIREKPNSATQRQESNPET